MATLERTFAPCPTTERGRASRLHGCAAGVARVAYGAGKVAVVRELADPTRCVVFMEHAHRVSCAALSPNGEWVASGDASGLVRVWPANLQEGQNEPTTKVEIRALAGPVEDIAWSGDGDRIAVAGASRGACVKAFTWNSGSAIGEMAGHSKGVLAVAFRPERPFKIATAGEDFYTNFYEGPPFKQAKASSNVHGNFVNAVTFSPDGALYATAGSDKRVFVWDGLTGEKKAEIAAHAGSIYALDWSADSKAFLTASADKTAKLWDAGSGECSTTFSFSDKPTLQDMQVGCAMVGDTMVTASLSGDLNFLDKANPSAPARVVKGHTRAVTALARGASADEFYSGGADGTILKWSTERGCVGPGGAPHSNPVVGMALDVGSGVLYSAAMDDTVRAGGESTPTEGQPKSHSLAQESANGTAVVVTTSGVCVYAGAKLLSTLGNDALGFEATTAAVSPDASQVAIGAPGGKIHMYELKGDTLTAAGYVLRRAAARARHFPRAVESDRSFCPRAAPRAPPCARLASSLRAAVLWRSTQWTLPCWRSLPTARSWGRATPSARWSCGTQPAARSSSRAWCTTPRESPR